MVTRLTDALVSPQTVAGTVNGKATLAMPVAIILVAVVHCEKIRHMHYEKVDKRLPINYLNILFLAHTVY